MPVPTPLDGHGHRVSWWFAFKFNLATFAGCHSPVECPFGGEPKHWPLGEGEQFAVATSEAPRLEHSAACIGGGHAGDPVGATFRQIYEGNFYFVAWNDQFKGDPDVCGESCGAPWAHSKGIVAWNHDGEGMLMQVSTPSWPGAGNRANPRMDGNTLGCTTDDNVIVSQHFFALKLTHDDLRKTMTALRDVRVVADPHNVQIARNGGPADIEELVNQLKSPSNATTPEVATLSTGVKLLAKPAKLHVPPWQMVSSLLGSAPLRVATWWNAGNKLPSTTAKTKVDCWSETLKAPGPVEIATSGTWEGKSIGLKGGNAKDGNHAKIGVTMKGAPHAAVILGDMNQEGALVGPKCDSAQNGRGGLFFVVEDEALHASVSKLLAGQSAPPSLQ